jgi:putrescine---pyruvate transaminase
LNGARREFLKVITSSLAVSDRQHLIHPLHHRQESDEAVFCISGRGVTIRDADGKEYIDGLSGLWNVNVGHGRKELAEVAAQQMESLAYFSAYSGSTTVPPILLAERLSELGGMSAVFFASGGSEANESAFKLARFYWQACGKPEKVKIISRTHAYHGVTLQAMSATGIPAYWKMFGPHAPGFVHVQTCYPYRFSGALPSETVAEAAARELETTILREGPETIAAFIGEPIHGAGGIIYPTDDYWPRIREICDRYDILFIADEIVTGFGRTGRWFALEHWKVKPDILSFAKAVTSGYLPLGGIMMTEPVRQAIESVGPGGRWMHGFTNSGHPTCCAVALKNLEIIERENLLENASRMGQLLLDSLRDSLGEHQNTGDIRGGRGLLAAVEFVADRESKQNFPPDQKVGARIQAEMRKRGLLTRTRPSAGEHPNPGDQVLFAPPLIITGEEIERMVGIAAESVHAVLGEI